MLTRVLLDHDIEYLPKLPLSQRRTGPAGSRIPAGISAALNVEVQVTNWFDAARYSLAHSGRAGVAMGPVHPYQMVTPNRFAAVVGRFLGETESWIEGYFSIGFCRSGPVSVNTGMAILDGRESPRSQCAVKQLIAGPV